MSSIQQTMLEEAKLIIHSVAFLDKQLNDLCATPDSDNEEENEKNRNQIQNLLNKLNRELLNMDSFMLKYKTIIHHEKEVLLSRFSQKKSSPVWSLCAK